MPNNNITDFTVEELVAQLQILTQGAPTTETTTATPSGNIMNPVQSAVSGRPWAKKSRFYNTIMNDGFIYNPFLHRRFLPVQFMRMMRINTNVIGQIKSNYSYNYSIDWLRSEVEKLALLEKTDPIAFAERKRFLTPEMIKAILTNYTANVSKVIKNISDKDRITADAQIFKYLKGVGWVNIGKKVLKVSKDGKKVEEFISPSKDGNKLVCELDRLINFSINAKYSDINTILKSFKWIELPNETGKGKAWIDCFYAQGAYYTIKHLITISNLSFKQLKGQDATNLLLSFADEQSYVLYAMLKECIEDNDYTIPRTY